MTEGYGLRIANALSAVRQLHSDAANILSEVDKLLDGEPIDSPIRGWRAIHGSYVTSDLSWDIRRGYYMAEGLYRHYQRTSENILGKTTPVAIRSITICLFNAKGIELTEPVILATDLLFREQWPSVEKKTQSVWVPWDAYFANFAEANTGVRIDLKPTRFKNADVAGGTLLAKKLYSISSREKLVDFCNDAWLTPTKQMDTSQSA